MLEPTRTRRWGGRTQGRCDVSGIRYPRVHLSAVTDGGQVRFPLADNGTGIGEHERVFERFYRGATHHVGTGLGLSICRTIVERHGGRIHVEGGPGGLGSAFLFTLPSAVVRLDPAPRSAVVPA